MRWVQTRNPVIKSPAHYTMPLNLTASKFPWPNCLAIITHYNILSCVPYYIWNNVVFGIELFLNIQYEWIYTIKNPQWNYFNIKFKCNKIISLTISGPPGSNESFSGHRTITNEVKSHTASTGSEWWHNIRTTDHSYTITVDWVTIVDRYIIILTGGRCFQGKLIEPKDKHINLS